MELTRPEAAVSEPRLFQKLPFADPVGGPHVIQKGAQLPHFIQKCTDAQHDPSTGSHNFEFFAKIIIHQQQTVRIRTQCAGSFSPLAVESSSEAKICVLALWSG